MQLVKDTIISNSRVIGVISFFIIFSESRDEKRVIFIKLL